MEIDPVVNSDREREQVCPDVTFPLEMTGSHLIGLEPSQSHQPKGWSLTGTVNMK